MVNVDICSVPLGQAVNGEGVPQVIWAWAGATMKGFEPGEAQQTSDVFRHATNVVWPSIRLNEKRSFSRLPSDLLPFREVSAQFSCEVRTERNQSSPPLAFPNQEKPLSQVYVTELEPNRFAESQSGAIEDE
jgi:hypothetical protein